MDGLKRERRKAGLTQTELAELAGTTQVTISEIETGNREPHASTLRKLARALGVEVADFFVEPVLPKVEASEAMERLRTLQPAQVRRLLAGLWPEWSAGQPQQNVGTIQEARSVALKLGLEPHELRELLVEVSPLEARRLLLGEEEHQQASTQALGLYERALHEAADQQRIDVREMFERREEFARASVA